MKQHAYQLIYQVEGYDDFKNFRLNNKKIISRLNHQFCFFTREACQDQRTIPYRKRDFFKISYLRGEYIVHYGDESLHIEGAVLSIFPPSVPYTIETLREEYNAGYIIFTDHFYDNFFKTSIHKFPLLKEGHKTVYLLNAEQENSIQHLFNRIQEHDQSTYEYKFDLIRNSLNELLHFANTLSPTLKRSHSLSTQERLVNIFKELLENQFPANPLEGSHLLRFSGDFADKLNVHVNYLNRTVKEVTGKTTRDHIYNRFVKESLILLNHSALSISEIAYTLGYKNVTHFNHFFKKQMNISPSEFRKQLP